MKADSFTQTAIDNMKYILKSKGETIGAFEAECGFSPGYLSKVSNIRMDVLVAFSRKYGISIDSLVAVNFLKKELSDSNLIADFIMRLISATEQSRISWGVFERLSADCSPCTGLDMGDYQTDWPGIEEVTYLSEFDDSCTYSESEYRPSGPGLQNEKELEICDPCVRCYMPHCSVYITPLCSKNLKAYELWVRPEGTGNAVCLETWLSTGKNLTRLDWLYEAVKSALACKPFLSSEVRDSISASF